MTDAARLSNVNAISEFRAAVISFIEDANKALLEADIEWQRTANWLRNEQPAYWNQQLRRRQDALEQARTDLRRILLSVVDGRPPSAIEQKKAVAVAEARLAEAQEKLKNVQRWSRLLEREGAEYKGLAQQLSTALEADLPRAIALLGRLSESVEAYLAVQPPSTEERTGAEGREDASAARAAETALRDRYPLPLNRPHRAAVRARLTELAREHRHAALSAVEISEQAPRLSPVEGAHLEALDLPRQTTDPNEHIIIEPSAFDGGPLVLFRAEIEDDAGVNRPWTIGSTRLTIAPGSALVTPLFRLLQERPDLQPIFSLGAGVMIVLHARGVSSVHNALDTARWSAPPSEVSTKDQESWTSPAPRRD